MFFPSCGQLGCCFCPTPDIDYDLVLAAPDPTFTEAVRVTAQTITVDPQALIASATAAISSVSVDADDVLSSTAVSHKRAAATTCVSQPAGATSAPTTQPTPTMLPTFWQTPTMLPLLRHAHSLGLLSGLSEQASLQQRVCLRVNSLYSSGC